MIEFIHWYDQQREKYDPVIRQFKPELNFYVGDDLSEFKLNIPAFQAELNSDKFQEKFDKILNSFRRFVARQQLLDGRIKTEAKETETEKCCKTLDAEGFTLWVDGLLTDIAVHEISLLHVALVELLFSLANTTNQRLKRQQSLYKQFITRLENSSSITNDPNRDWFCNNCDTLIDQIGVVTKNHFNDNDLQYPLLLALSLSHTSPRHVREFLHKQTPQYKGDFKKVLGNALLEYDDLLLPNQIKEAHKWLDTYEPPLSAFTEFSEVVVDEAEIVAETDGEETEIEANTIDEKPVIHFHSAVVDEVYEALKPSFDKSEHTQLETLLKGGTIEGEVYFKGQNATLLAFFRDLINAKVINVGKQKTARWLHVYFKADKQKKDESKTVSESTATNYFKSDTKPQIEIDIKAILLKKNQKNTV